MTGAAKIAYGILWITIWVSLPSGIIWSWVRWARAKKPRTIFSILSVIGLTLATAAALLALLPVVYERSFVFGFAQSFAPDIALSGVVFGLCGALRPNPLRWHGLGCATAMLLVWFVSLVLG